MPDLIRHTECHDFAGFWVPSESSSGLLKFLSLGTFIAAETLSFCHCQSLIEYSNLFVLSSLKE